MKISKERLRTIVKEEFINHVRGLLSEAPKSPSVTDSEEDNTEKDAQEKDDAKKGKKPVGRPPKSDPKTDKKMPPPETPDGEEGDEPESKLDEPAGGEEQDTEDAADVTGGKIADELQGKTIQSIALNPKSKVLPGSQEIVISFSQIPEPLKILVNKTGGIKFLFKGLHQKL